MLAAHLVPGYFVVIATKPYWSPDWNPGQRGLLWLVTFAGTVLPDSDVIYNALCRGFINHSWLWTHSLFVCAGLGILWFCLKQNPEWRYGQTLVGLLAVGWLSHLVLDVISHGTPLFYPVSSVMIGEAPPRVLQGGFWYYITDPIFLLEPLLFMSAGIHWAFNSSFSLRTWIIVGVVFVNMFIVFISAFLMTLPMLQNRFAN
jgi:hypothetical protein